MGLDGVRSCDAGLTAQSTTRMDRKETEVQEVPNLQL